MTLVVSSVRAEYHSDTPTVGVPRPRLSWKTRTDVPGWLQASAELQWTAQGASVTAIIEGGAAHLVPWPFVDLAPHALGELRVRVTGNNGIRSDWSEPLGIAAGFLAKGEWTARFIGAPDPNEPAQPFLTRHAFTVRPGIRAATLFATAQGVYQAEVNGTAVDDQILKPGWTPYGRRLIHETTDITALLVEGSNVLGATVAGGWYTESYGFGGMDRRIYGDQPSFAAQIALDYEDGSRETIRSDASWRVTTDTPLVSSGIYAGEDFDARRAQTGWSTPEFDAAAWERPALVDGAVEPTARTSPAVRAIEEVPVHELITSSSGRTILDFGQNLVGWLRIHVTGSAGDTITLRHAEVLEHGELGVRPLRRATATDTYTLNGDGQEVWEPQFTFHGFRYAEVEGWPGDLDPADVTAVVIHSDMERSGWFSSSHPLVNRLHENVVWGMRGNFLYLPTDCPQRDERMGWTGDIQVFSPTASYLYECDGFLASWLVDLALEQDAGGGVPLVVPDALDSASTPAAAWGDAATIVPWVLYERFGDLDVLRTQYDSMQGWVEHILDLAGPTRLWEGSFQFGDWLDPDAPADRPEKAKTDSGLIATAYLFRSTDILARTAELLERTFDAARYRTMAEAARHAWLAHYVTPAGRVTSDAQTAYAVAIEFGIPTDADLIAKMGDRLAWLARRDGYRIGTGFVGTPLVQHALSRTGHLDTASRLLLQSANPSWLYSVTMGATTIWERWDSMLEDGSINAGEMTSFNHYSLGAIADWLHGVVAGLSAIEPGYRAISIAPHPIRGLQWAETAHETPAGLARVRWEEAVGSRLTVTATIPPNTSATVTLPGQERFQVGSGTHAWEVADPRQTPVIRLHSLDSSLADIIDDQAAYWAVLDALERADPALRREFSHRTAFLDQQPLIGPTTMWTADVVAEIARALDDLNAGRSA